MDDLLEGFTPTQAASDANNKNIMGLVGLQFLR